MGEISTNWYGKLVADCLKLKVDIENNFKIGWFNLGSRILSDEEKFWQRQKYGDHSYEKLADELDIDRRYLQEAIRIVKQTPQKKTFIENTEGLSYKHVRLIARLPVDKREHVFKQAKTMSANKLQSFIKTHFDEDLFPWRRPGNFLDYREYDPKFGYPTKNMVPPQLISYLNYFFVPIAGQIVDITGRSCVVKQVMSHWKHFVNNYDAVMGNKEIMHHDIIKDGFMKKDQDSVAIFFNSVIFTFILSK